MTVPKSSCFLHKTDSGGPHQVVQLPQNPDNKHETKHKIRLHKTLTTIKQQPSNTTVTAPVQKAAIAVKRRGRPKAQPVATCQMLDTIEEVNEDSQMYPDLDFGKTESEAPDLCEILEENSDLSVDEPLIDLATDQT